MPARAGRVASPRQPKPAGTEVPAGRAAGVGVGQLADGEADSIVGLSRDGLLSDGLLTDGLPASGLVPVLSDGVQATSAAASASKAMRRFTVNSS